eukprot:UN33145
MIHSLFRGRGRFSTRWFSEAARKKLPVTILSGHLGSGKTTLLNNLLNACDKENKKIAVVQNEFGEISLDDQLIAERIEGKNEDIVVTNSGCLCCTVRGDLLEIFNTTLIPKFDNIDHVFIETTGLAFPGPIIQSFFQNPKMSQWTEIDGVLTLIDCENFNFFTTDEKVKKETLSQLAFADRIVLSKTDLCTPEQISNVESSLKNIKF